MDKDNDNSAFQIKLTGAPGEVDTVTLVDVLSNLAAALHQINDDLRLKKSVRINIKAFSPGSFDVFLNIKEHMMDPIYQFVSSQPGQSVAYLVTTLAGILEIKKHLKGCPPKEIRGDDNDTTITNCDGANITVVNKIYNISVENQIIDAAITKTFNALSDDDLIDGFEMFSEEKDRIFESSKNDFKFLSCQNNLPGKESRELTEETALTIFKVVFEKGYKWQFYFRGVKIHAVITDDTFYQKIDRGAKFSKGDTLIVELKILQDFDNSVQAFINKEYEIIRVVNHITRQEQQKLFKK